MTQLVEKKVNLKLVGLYNGSFFLMNAFRSQARKEGWSYEEIDQVLIKAQMGDHEHFLVVLSEHCVNDGK